MKMFTKIALLFLVMVANLAFAQYQPDDPNRDQIPQYLRERVSSNNTDAPFSSIITIDNWDNFSLGVDQAEGNIAAKVSQPNWYFAAYNTNGTHHTENGMDWAVNNPSFGVAVQGDPVQSYDSIGNLFYENMYGNITGCKVVKSTTNGATWGTAVTAIAGGDKNWLACDQTAGPYANYVYTVMTNTSYNAGNFARSIDNGATFQQTYTATPHTMPGMMVCVGPDGNTQGGSVYIVTHSGASFNSTYTFFVSHDGGATFTMKSSQQFANTVGSQVSGRNSVENMRTRPYPMIAADNSYGPNRGKFYVVYASNDPPGNGNKPDIFCRSSTDGGATWTSAVKVNDDVNTAANHQWHPAIWCDKETGKLYVMWMDTRDTPTHDSAFIYASYSADGGATFVANQRISNKKMKINCTTCNGGGTPRYQGDYNGVVSNKKVSMLAWTDFRNGNFLSMTGYFPDYAMAIDKSADTLFAPLDNTTIQVSIPEVKLYTDSVVLSGSIAPVPTAGSITFEYPDGNTITTYPASKPVKLVLTGNVPVGNYMATFNAIGPNGTPAHKRTCTIKVLEGNVFVANASATPATICAGVTPPQTSQLNVSVIGGTPPFTYAWTPAGSLTNPAISNPVASPDVTTTYNVTVTDNTMNTATGSVEVVVNTWPAAPGPITGSQTICAGDTVDYAIVEVVGGVNYNWSVEPEGPVIIGNNTPNVSIIWGTASGDIKVTVSNDCGPNPITSILPVTVKLPPTTLTPVTGPDAVCSGDEATFSTSSEVDVVYEWTVPADVTIVSGQGTNSINVTWGATAGTVTVFGVNDCGETPVNSKDINVNTIPEPAGAISGKDTICQGTGNMVYTVPTIAGATQYIWSTPADVTITAGSGTNEVTLQYGASAQSGNITVKGNNDCGDGVQSVKAVVVKNCTGIDQKTLEATVRIYPNPVSNELTLSIMGKEQQLSLTFTNQSGQVVYSERLENIPADFMKKLDASQFAKGVYLLKLSNKNRTYTEKVIVK